MTQGFFSEFWRQTGNLAVLNAYFGNDFAGKTNKSAAKKSD